ncbi:MAG TPA: hypothetical protein VMF30_04570 [Pirellulales bacterium]|nr:hypothetical protein [Pirellulales bacterium]
MINPAFDLNLHRLILTVRDPALFDIAEDVARNMHLGTCARTASRLLILCANADDLNRLGHLIEDRTPPPH